MHADVDRLDDVVVRKPGGGPALFIEALDELAVLAHLLGQHFDGDDAIQRNLPGLVDRRHRPFADLADDLIARDLRPLRVSSICLRMRLA